MANFPEIDQQKSFKYLVEVETVGQDILTLKDEKLELSNAQNKFREALRALEQSDDRNSWIKLGSLYVQRPTEECKTILRREINKAEDALKDLHEEIRSKVHKLRDLEHEPRLEGFTLKPISVAEAKALHKGFGSY
ncbi:hypothetical protein GWI33_022100 [Rhynchophorus ferrugineus]|uniref:P53 and DNA damage-regulated protein 1 n=1 Tax=Rhynchophorus ferrugineus TaxID=354439 RepID=A0A834IV78_RHYFE|nr:hypothetical protein GWI33_022100 [Rhynchophorus ferrugineus]